MKVRPLLAVVLVVSIGLCSPAANQEKLKISVYYEILCPDCSQFIKDQLYPVFTEMSKYIRLDLVPYGIASTETLPNGTYSFKCQHGEAECYGNKVHACAISLLEPEAAAAFVNCSENQSNPYEAGPYCSDLLQIPFTQIKDCAESDRGSSLLAANGRRTNSLNPTLYWVPWITYDDVFFSDDLDPSQANLLPVVCKHLRGSKPKECNEIYN